MLLTSYLDKGETDLQYKQVLSEAEYQEAYEKYGNTFRVGMGAEAIKELLEAIDLEKDSVELKAALKTATGQKRARIIKTSGSCRSIPRVRQQTGVDDHDSYPGYSTRFTSDGTVGWWTFCDIRSERFVSVESSIVTTV